MFAGEAYTQLPLTSDYVSAKMYLNSLNTEMIQTQGTSVGDAIALASNAFSPAPTINPAIVLITDAEDHEGNAVDMAREAAKNGIQVDVLGIGSPKGNPIPLDKRGSYLKDNSGNVVTTALNEEAARQIAEAGNGVYVNAASSDALGELTDKLDELEKGDIRHIVYKTSAEQFPIFGWIALVFLIADIFILDRKIGWLRKINFFSK